MGTAVMTNGFISGKVFAWRLGDIGDIGMGYYRSSAVYSSVFVFSASLLNPSFGGNAGYGYSVLRYVIIHQFFFLGSYGLAVGTRLTNADTAVSLFDLFKTGWYFVGDSVSSGVLANRNGYGYFWFSTATEDTEARRMYYGDGSLQIGVRYKHGAGYSIR